MSFSWTLVRSPKHSEKMLIQLRTPTAPSWPAVQCIAPCDPTCDPWYLQVGHGGWHAGMMEAVGRRGRVHRITERGLVR